MFRKSAPLVSLDPRRLAPHLRQLAAEARDSSYAGAGSSLNPPPVDGNGVDLDSITAIIGDNGHRAQIAAIIGLVTSARTVTFPSALADPRCRGGIAT